MQDQQEKPHLKPTSPSPQNDTIHAHGQETPSNQSPHSDHRRVEDRVTQQLRIWWALVAHLIISIALALCMILLLDKYKALGDEPGTTWELLKLRYRAGIYKLRVSEVTTFISAALVLVRLMVSSWTAVTIWRCAYILMEETQGIQVSRLSSMMVWRIPFSRPNSRGTWVVAIVLILLFPQSFIGPLVTGAVGWSTSSELIQTTQWNFTGRGSDSVDLNMKKHIDKYKNKTGEQLPELSDEEVDRLEWEFMRYGRPFQMQLPMKAAALISTMWPARGVSEPGITTLGEGGRGSLLCRQGIAKDHTTPVPVNSIVYGAALPCISIEGILWEKPSEEIKTLVKLDPVFDELPGMPNLQNISIWRTNLFEPLVPGMAILFDPKLQNLTETYPQTPNASVQDWPKAEKIDEVRSLLVVLDYFLFDDTHATAVDPSDRPCTLQSLDKSGNIFGPLPSTLTQDSLIYNGLFCFAYAKVHIKAGVVNFKESNFTSPFTVEGKTGGTGNDAALDPTDSDFQASPWSRPALFLLPDVMVNVAIANTSYIPTWGNLDEYIGTLILRSYLASWNILRGFQVDQASLNIAIAEHRLIATVNPWRVWGWFIINMFVPLSGIVWYLGAQRHSKRNLIVDAPMVALFTDVSEVVSSDREVTNLSYLTDQDNENLGKLFLKSNYHGQEGRFGLGFANGQAPPVQPSGKSP